MSIIKRRTLAIAATLVLGLGASSGLFCALGIAGLLGLEGLPAFAGEDDKTASGCQPIDKDLEGALKRHFEKRFFEKIKATDEQREKISALLTARMDETRPLREDLKRGAVELAKLMVTESSDAEVTEKAHALRDKHSKLQDERLLTLLKVRALLTTEQKKQISDRITNLLSGNVSPRGLLRG